MSKNYLKTFTNLNGSHGGFAFSLSASISIAVSFLFSLIVALIANSLNVPLANLANDTWVIITSFLLGSVICISTILICKVKFNINLKPLITCAKNEKTWLTYLCAALITFGVMFGLSEVNIYFLEFLKGLGLSPSEVELPVYSPLNFTLCVVCVCVLPAIFEEFLFRGIITYSLKGYGEVFAILVSGALFSLFHMNPAQTVYQFVFGALFAFIALRAGNILPVILAHFVNNFFIVLNYYFLNFNLTGDTKINVMIVALVSLVAGVTLMAVFVKSEKIDKKPVVTKKEFFIYAIIGLIICLSTWLTKLV